MYLGSNFEFQHHNLTDITTPIKVDEFAKLLRKSNYDRDKAKFLIDGFSEGFDLQYCGPLERRDTSKNLPLTVGTKKDLWNKIMKEVSLGRYAGPYADIPYKDRFIQSPIGLVPKAENQTRNKKNYEGGFT